MQQFFPSLPVCSLADAGPDRRLRFLGEVVPRLVRLGLAVITVTLTAPASIAANGPSPRVPTCGADGSWHLIWHGGGELLEALLRELVARFDLVLVEGADDLELTTIVLDGRASSAAGNAVVFGPEHYDPEKAAATLYDHLAARMRALPIWACILIGGRSSRMGRPKHLLPAEDGRSWFERSWQLVTRHVAGVAVAGGGELPVAAQGLPRIPDVEGLAGPLAGILAAFRWRPEVAWLVLACDMPAVDESAIAWILAQRHPGRWGVVPRLGLRRMVEPLLACYEPQARSLFEELAAGSISRVSAIAEFERIGVVEVPARLHRSWRNVNTPEELQRFHGEPPSGGSSR